MLVACLVDTTRCIGCRSCQVACKQSNRLEAEKTRFFAAPGGYQNPPRYSGDTFTYIAYHEGENENGDPAWAFVKHQCLHCQDVYCAVVCPTEVFHRTPSGVVAYQADNCIGCAACIDACPFRVPAVEYWEVGTPRVRKCTFCVHRQGSDAELLELNGRPLPLASSKRYRHSFRTPACAKACPTGTIQYGGRDALLAEARRRIAAEPRRYVDHVYGEKEAGGTGWLYLAGTPFDRLGFPTRFEDIEMFHKQQFGAVDRPEGSRV